MNYETFFVVIATLYWVCSGVGTAIRYAALTGDNSWYMYLVILVLWPAFKTANGE